jgi:hypothetical protein
MPFATGLAAVFLGVLGPAIAASAATPAGHGNTARDQEWWLPGLNVTQVWPKTQGAGVIVAVLGTGVDASYPGLAGSVITGPDYTASGRAPGSPYWGVEGTAVAGIIAAHQGGSGLVGVAPAVKILSVRVTLEFNDPLASGPAISRRLPQAIADGIRYAADHGARIIDLPLDPGTLGLTSKGDPAAAGGSPAERAAVAYALSKGVVLVAPAGDDGEGSGIVNYPAAYPGVIAVGAIGRNGRLAPFSSRRPYASLTAPGVGLVAAAPPDAYQTVSSTSTASGIVAGVAALVLSSFPHLTVAQVTQALADSTVATAAGGGLPPLPARSQAGAGYGTVNAIRAVDAAALITSASQPRRPAPVVRPHHPVRHPVASPHRPAASALAGSVLRDAVAAVSAIIVLLVVALLVGRSRRNRAGRVADRTRPRGQHQHRRPTAAAGAATAADDAVASRPSPGWAASGGWQGGGIGELRAAPGPSAVARVPRSSYRRGAGRPDANSGPPWAPAPAPKRLIDPLPVASAGPPLPDPGGGIRLPGDMAALTDPSPPVSFDLVTPPPGFDLSTPAFGLTPPTFDAPPPAVNAPPTPFDAAPTACDAAPPTFEAAPSTFEAALPSFEAPEPAGTAPPAEPLPAGPLPATALPAEAPPTEALPPRPLPTRQSLGFAAAPVPTDYAVPTAGPASEPAQAADPSYIWDLAATDVFPPATDATGAAIPEDDGAGES